MVMVGVGYRVVAIGAWGGARFGILDHLFVGLGRGPEWARGWSGMDKGRACHVTVSHKQIYHNR